MNEIQFASKGKNVQIDSSVIFIHPEKIHLGNNVRIDAFSIISGGGGIRIGNNVHIAAYCQLAAAGASLEVADFCGISSRCSIFTATDDYKEGYLTGPTIPDEYKKISAKSVILERHVIIGCGSVILPGCELKTGASVGAMSLVHKDVPKYAIVVGCPYRIIGHRDRSKLEQMERNYLQSIER